MDERLLVLQQGFSLTNEEEIGLSTAVLSPDE